MREARRYLEEHREFHNLAISTSLVGQLVVAHYFLKKPPAKTAKRVPGLRPPAPYLPFLAVVCVCVKSAEIVTAGSLLSPSASVSSPSMPTAYKTCRRSSPARPTQPQPRHHSDRPGCSQACECANDHTYGAEPRALQAHDRSGHTSERTTSTEPRTSTEPGTWSRPRPHLGTRARAQGRMEEQR